MQICAEALELGQQILREEQEKERVDLLVASQRGQAYLQALGQIHLATRLLDSSMRAHMPEIQRPAAFQSCLQQCREAWNSGESSLDG